MDITALHAVTEALAEYLSEMTHGDLRQPTSVDGRDVGDLYVHLIDQNINTAAGLVHGSAPAERPGAGAITRSALDVAPNLYGGGYEGLYRRTARHVENAFAQVTDVDSPHYIGGTELTAKAWYEIQIDETLLCTKVLSHAMGFTHHVMDGSAANPRARHH